MKLSSPAFANGKKIPDKYAHKNANPNAQNVSPALQFSDVPSDTKTFALIVDDPDAPMGTFVHWIAWGIDGKTRELPEGAKVPHQGSNHYKEKVYGGPCPPPGKPHRYFFKLYALDTDLKIPEGSSKEAVVKAMQGHILAEAELMGTYER